MSQVTKPLNLGPEIASLAPQHVNALLFYQLAQFVVWGHAHRDLAAAHPDFALLLQTATTALSRGGVLDDQGSSVPARAEATNPVSDSESLACDVVSKGERNEN
jgi:hypothetical protein